MAQHQLSDAENAEVARRWGEHTSASDAFSTEVYWLAVLEVYRRHQFRITGSPDGNWVEFVAREYLPHPLPVGRILSLGCGDGSLERTLAALGAFRECDAWDLSPGAIEQAASEARKAGFPHILYKVVDLNHLRLPAGTYDAVWFNGSLHHVSALEHVLDQVRRTLKPHGVMILHEYVGPSQFAFAPRQKEAISAAFALIPKRLRRSCFPENRGAFVEHPPIPDPANVRAADPSEAVRSAEIMDAVRERFDLVLDRQAGGTILQFLLSGIAGNFQTGDEGAMRVLRMLFEIEDALVDLGDLQSDFVLVVATPKR